MRTLKDPDSFKRWFDKHNELITTGIPGSFSNDPDQNSGLDFYVRGGVLQSNDTKIEIADTSVTLADGATSFVYVSLLSGAESITSALEGSLPASDAVVLYKVTTANGQIETVEDYRSWPEVSKLSDDHDALSNRNASDAHPQYEYRNAVGKMNTPLVDMPLRKNRDVKRLTGEYIYVLKSDSTYIDHTGILRKNKYYTGVPDASDAFSIDHSIANFADLEGYVAYLTDGTNDAYRWVEANTSTKAIWSEAIGFTPTEYHISKPRHEKEGQLLESGTSNELSYSEDFDNDLWTKEGSNVFSNRSQAPDESFTADRLKEDTSSSSHAIGRSVTLNDDKDYTFSVFAKADGRSWVALRLVDKSGGVNTVWYDIANGAVGTSSGTVGYVTVVPLANGWYRCTATFNSSLGVTPSKVYIMLSNLNGSSAYTGDGSSGAYVWGVQLEPLPYPSSYVPTDVTFVSRASGGSYHNSAGAIRYALTDEARYGYHFINGQWQPVGLVDENAATNLVTYSEEFDASYGWTNQRSSIEENQAASPDDFVTADKMIEDTSNDTHDVYKDVDASVDVTYTASVYVKAAERTRMRFGLVGLAIDNVTYSLDLTSTQDTDQSWYLGNGWHRVFLTQTASADGSARILIQLEDDTGVAIYPGDGVSGIYIWGAQIEAGNKPTSYIPTRAQFVSRASVGTYIDSNGVLQTAGVDEARTNHVYDGTKWVSERLLVEDQSTNLLTYSEEYEQSGWSKLRCFIENNVEKAPDGTYTADRLIEDTSADASHVMYYTLSPLTSDTFAFSVYAKAAEKSFIRLVVNDQDATPDLSLEVFFDLSQGIVGDTGGSTGSFVRTDIEPSVNGWYRCSLVVQATSSTVTPRAHIYLSQGSTLGSATYTGDGVSGIYIWGAQFEEGPESTSYIPTRAEFVSRASTGTYFDSNGVMREAAIDEARTNYVWDGTQWVSQGLLVEPRDTNTILYSENFGKGWTLSGVANLIENARLAPDNTMTMDKIVFPAGELAYLYQIVTVVPDSTYTASWYAQLGTLDAPTDCLYGIYDHTNSTWIVGPVNYTPDSNKPSRHYTSFTVPSTCNEVRVYVARNSGPGSAGGTISVWGAQLELVKLGELDTPTSYIPTLAQFVSRASKGSYVDSNGVVQEAEYHVPRTNYAWDGTQWITEKLLVEDQATNLLTYSEEFDNAVWLNTRSTTIQNVIEAPDGSITADKIVEDTSVDGTHHVLQAADTALFTVGKTYVGSVYAKAGERSYLEIKMTDFISSWERAYFNLATGEVGLISDGSVNAGIEKLSNGWYRCYVAVNRDASKDGIDARFWVMPAINDTHNASIYTGDGTSGIYIWGAQLEEGDVPTSYISTMDNSFLSRASEATYTDSNGVLQTAGVDVNRSSNYVWDGSQWIDKGPLWESASTNLLTYSEEFETGWSKPNITIEKNALLSPDGIITTDKMISGTNVDATNGVGKTLTPSASTTYTASAFMAPAGYNYAVVQFRNFHSTGWKTVIYDLVNGTITQTTDSNISGTIEDRNGFFRISATITTDQSVSSAVHFAFTDSPTTPFMTGDGTSGIYIWGAQLEETDSPTSYISTKAEFVSRASEGTYVDSSGNLQTAAVDVARTNYTWDGSQYVSQGLLAEDAATNLITYSEDLIRWATPQNAFVTSDATTLGGGAVQGDKVTAINDGITGVDTNTMTITADTYYTFSIFAKAGNTDGFGIIFKDFYSTGWQAGTLFFDGTVDGSVGAVWEYIGEETFADGSKRFYCRVYADQASSSAKIQVRVNNNDAYPLASDHVFVGGAQLEEGYYPSSYIPTPASFTSRASEGTYFDSNGVLQTAAIDTARTNYSYDGAQWNSEGLLIEDASTNLLLHSEDFTTLWSRQRITVTADAATAPDGAVTMDKLVEDTSLAASHYIDQIYSSTFTNGQRFVFSVFAKAGERTSIQLRTYHATNGGTGYGARYDLSTGTVISDFTTDSGIEDVGGGIYRCWLLVEVDDDTQTDLRCRVLLLDANDNSDYDGDGTSGAYVWGAQLEEGNVATSYIPTTTATVSRSADVTSSSSVTRSADVVTSSAATREADVLDSAIGTREADVVTSVSTTREADVVTSSESTREADVASSTEATREADVTSSGQANRFSETLNIHNLYNHPSIKDGSEFSFVLEANTHNTVGYERTLLTAGYNEVGINDHSLLRVSNGSDQVLYYRAGGGSLVKNGNLETMDRICVTVDEDGIMKIYLNGTKTYEGPPTLADETGVDADFIGIGSRSGGGTALMGHVRNVKIYDYALSEDEARIA